MTSGTNKKDRAPHAPAPAWPADWAIGHIERRALAELLPNARNARKHTSAQVEEIATSIRHYGWTMPVLVDEDGTILAGHGRVLAAQTLNYAHVPVIVARGWSGEKKRAYMLADNKITLNGSWDRKLLAVELGELRQLGADMRLTGFRAGELTKFLQPASPKENKQPAGDAIRYVVIIECADATTQASTLKKLGELGYTCRPSVLKPGE